MSDGKGNVSSVPVCAPVHFLHVGKTGGTALTHALERTPVDWLHLHKHATRLADIPQGERVFFFLRDPVTRFISGFYSRKRRGSPRFDAVMSAAEEEAFAIFPTPGALAAALSSRDAAVQAAATGAMRNIQHVRDSYWYWLGSAEALWQRREDILFIGQQEYLEADVAVLARLLGLPIELPRDPVQAHVNPEGLDYSLSEEARANLVAWSAGEYRAVEACVELARSRGFGGSLQDAPPVPQPSR